MNNPADTAPVASTNAPITYTYRYAVLDDADSIAQLVNSAYRGDTSRAGWTTEADLLDGTRITADEVREQIKDKESLILLCLQNHKMIGCVHLQKMEETAYFGMFVVQPTLQGAGIGKAFMQEAETRVKNLWNTKKMWMAVISIRSELIAYYERRGYLRTGRCKPFEVDISNGIAKVANLQFEELEKRL